MRPNNILFVFPNADIGGISTGLLGMARHLNTRRYHPLAVALSSGPAVRFFQKHRIPCSVAPSHRPFEYLRDLIDREDIRLVQSCDSASAGACAARSRNVPHAWYFGGRPEDTFSAPARSLRHLLSWIDSLSSAVIVQSRALQELFAPHTTAKKLRVIPWGVEPSRFHRSRSPGWLKRQLGMHPEDPLVAMVGNFYPAKRHLDFIRAAQRIHSAIPRARFLIAAKPVGATAAARRISHQTRRQVLQAIGQSGLRKIITCTDFLAEERENWYREFDSLLVPSIEGMGQAMLEAGSVGTPIIAANIGGVPEVIRDGYSGLLVPYRNPPAMAQAAIRIIRNPASAKNLGRSLKNHILSNLTAEKQAKHFEEFYETILDKHSRHIKSIRC